MEAQVTTNQRENDLEVTNFEEPIDDQPLEVPADRRRVKTDKRDLPVETLLSWVTRSKLDLQPEFQRRFVWDGLRASRLIESLLLDIPIPVVYVSEEGEGRYVVVDGQQRLTSICAFINGRFPDGREFRLSRLQVLTELNGKTFRELDASIAEPLLAATLRLIVIEQDSDPAVKFEVFERLNLGAVRLTEPELRNCVYRGRYNRLLAELAEDPFMLKVMGASAPHPRMADRQLILRFFALWRITHLKYRGPMKQVMNREIEQHRDPSDIELTELRTLFTRSIELAWIVFGPRAFRRYRLGNANRPGGDWQPGLNVALWDTVLYSFAYFDKRQVQPVVDSIREELLDLMTNDSRFAEYLSSSTDVAERVQYRAEAWLARLRAVIGTDNRGPRSFSLRLKQELFDTNPTCAICGQRIHHIDDAEVDHIVQYWRGGRTIPENARLAHRYCNRARGGRPYPEHDTDGSTGRAPVVVSPHLRQPPSAPGPTESNSPISDSKTEGEANEYRETISDLQRQLRPWLVGLVAERNDLVVIPRPDIHVTFTTTLWDQHLGSSTGRWEKGMTGLLYFVFRNRSNRITVDAFVGPGPQDLRQILIEAARAAGRPFAVRNRETRLWGIVYQKTLVSSREYSTMDLGAMKQVVREGWELFLIHDFPVIQQRLNPVILSFDGQISGARS